VRLTAVARYANLDTRLDGRYRDPRSDTAHRRRARKMESALSACRAALEIGLWGPAGTRAPAFLQEARHPVTLWSGARPQVQPAGAHPPGIPHRPAGFPQSSVAVAHGG